MAVAPLIDAFLERHRKADTDLIERAYRVAWKAHAEQVRRSGEPYISHPVGVAMILADLGLDDVTIAAALLHDAVEDTATTDDDIERDFGPDVAAIVDGVTKLDRLQFNSKEAQQAATLRKMLVAMAKDIRVLLIKLADRLHNMRTIASLPGGQAAAHRPGDPRHLRAARAPARHRRREVAARRTSRSRSCTRSATPRSSSSSTRRPPSARSTSTACSPSCTTGLTELRIEADVRGRPKHYWSIYEKMVVKNKEFDEVQDLVGIRVVVETVKDCYAALGSIHALWRPVQGRFKDYIAMPKFNLYQSLHTTVIGPGGRLVEVQIRTKEMHRRAEYGIAAHWGYKERDETNKADDLVWLQRLVDWQQETEDPAEFMQSAEDRPRAGRGLRLHAEGQGRHDAHRREPGGLRLRDPHRGRAPVHRGRVNGRLVPLDSTLASGDTVEIFTSKVEGRRPEPRLAAVRADPGPGPRSASGSPVSDASTRSTPAATSW